MLHNFYVKLNHSKNITNTNESQQKRYPASCCHSHAVHIFSIYNLLRVTRQKTWVNETHLCNTVPHIGTLASSFNTCQAADVTSRIVHSFICHSVALFRVGLKDSDILWFVISTERNCESCRVLHKGEDRHLYRLGYIRIQWSGYVAMIRETRN